VTTVAIFTACLVYGTGCVVITFLGFAAAFKESKKLLLLNAASLSFGLILGIGMISLHRLQQDHQRAELPRRPALHRRRCLAAAVDVGLRPHLDLI
jgi:hypothetical protein